MEEMIDFSGNSGRILYAIISVVLTMVLSFIYNVWINSKKSKKQKDKVDKKETAGMKKTENTKEKQNLLVLLFCIILSFSVTAFVLTFLTSSFHKISFGNATFSISMQDWGAYATCLATITSFVSIVLIYLTYKSQTEMYKEQIRVSYLSKFNEVFTSMLQVQRDLYKKTNPNIFYELHKHVNEWLDKMRQDSISEEFLSEHKKQFFRNSVKEAYGFFFNNNRLSRKTLILPNNYAISMFTPREVDSLRNYFKYLYHIICYVVFDKELSQSDKETYMDMIQAQMSTDELFCYMINVMDYCYRVDGRISNSIPDDVCDGEDKDQENEAYLNTLFKFDFFKDLFRKPNDVENNRKLDDLFYEEFDFDSEKCRRNENPRTNLKLFPLDSCNVKK